MIEDVVVDDTIRPAEAVCPPITRPPANDGATFGAPACRAT
jgi:hypothetical protein